MGLSGGLASNGGAVSGGGAAAATRLPGPDGNPTTVVTADTLRPAIEAPVVISRNDGNMLFAPNPVTELDVLNDAGLLWTNALGYFSPGSTPRGQIVSMPGLLRKGFQLGTAAAAARGVPTFSLDGILPIARWEIQTWLYLPGTIDLAGVSGNAGITLWNAVWGNSMTLLLQTSAGFLLGQLSVAEGWTGGTTTNIKGQIALLQPLAGCTVATTSASPTATVTVPANIVANGTTASGTNQITAWAGTAPPINSLIAGAGIPANSYVTAYNVGTTTITISNNASASATVSITVSSGAPAVGMWVNSTNVPAGTYLSAVSGAGPYTVTLSNNASATASGTGINGSDCPAQTLVPVVLAFDGNTVTLRLANNTRNNASSAYTSTWLRRTPSVDLRAKVSGGFRFLSNSVTGLDNGVQVAVAIIDSPQTPAASSLIDRTAKLRIDASITSVTGTGTTANASPVVTSFTPATVAPYPGMAVAGTNIPAGTLVAPNGVFGPKADGTFQLTLTKNATGTNSGLTFTPSAFPQYLAGVVKPYSAWQATETLETADAGASWRAAQCSLLAGLKIPLIRDADYHLRAIPTVGTTPGTVTSTNLTDVYARLDRVHAGYGGAPNGAATTPWRLHLTISYTPAALGGTSGNSYHEPPNVATTGSGTSTTSSTSITGYTGPAPAVGQTVSGLGIPAAQAASGTTNGTTSVTWTGAGTPAVGSVISGVGIPLDATITVVAGGTGAWTLTISSAATLSATNTLTITPAITVVAGTTLTVSVASSAGTTGTLTVNWTRAQSFAAWGQWAVQILQGINSRYPGVLYSVTPWNEPENSWNVGTFATVDNFAQLWLAAASAIQTANITVAEGQLYAGGTDGEYSTSVSGAHGTGGNGGDYQRQMLAVASTASQKISALYLHSYDASTALMVENMHGLTAEASSRSIVTPAGVTPPVRVTEINWTLNYGGDSTTLLWGHGAKDTLGNSINGAGYLLRAAHEIATAGGDMMAVYRGFPPSTYLTASIGEEVLGIAGASANPRPWAQGSMLELLAKNSGTRVACDSNRPYLFAFASVTGTTTTITGGCYRQYQSRELLPIQFEEYNIPAGWTKWKLWQLDWRTLDDGRPYLVSQGDTTNPPSGTTIAATGIFCLQFS